MKLIYLLCALPILTHSENKTGKWKKKAFSKSYIDCKNITCPAIEDPVCVKMKFKNANITSKPTYILMINKCELKYMKCHQHVDGAVVQMKYCDHNHFTKSDKPKLSTNKRPKRSAVYDSKNEQTKKAKSKVSSNSKKLRKGNSQAKLDYKARPLTPAKVKYLRKEKSDPATNVNDETRYEEVDETHENQENNGQMNQGNMFAQNMFGKNMFGSLEKMFKIAQKEARSDNNDEEANDSGNKEKLQNSNGKESKKQKLFKGTMYDEKMLNDDILQLKAKKGKETSENDNNEEKETQSNGKGGSKEIVMFNDKKIMDRPMFDANKDFSAPMFGSPEVKNDAENDDNRAQLSGSKNDKNQLAGSRGTELKDVTSAENGEGVVLEGGPKPENRETFDDDKSPPTDGSEPELENTDNNRSEEEKEQEELTNASKMAADEDSEADDYESECPDRCPTRAVMICGRCEHGVYRTFLSICHMRMFSCRHANEKMDLISRHPCVASAPYLSSNKDMNLDPKGRVDLPDDHDKILRFIYCRSKGMVGDANTANDNNNANYFTNKCKYNSKTALKPIVDYATYWY